MVNGDSPKVISGVPLANSGDESFGDIDLTTALTYSVNTVWAQVAEKLGKAHHGRVHAEASASTRDPPLDYPDGQMLPSGEYRNGALLPPTSRLRRRRAHGRSARTSCSVTPLQMAMVAAAVANGGELHEAAR